MKRFAIEFGAVLLLAAFMFFMLRDKGTTGVLPSEIEQKLTEAGLLEQMTKASDLTVKRNLGLDYEELGDFVYYSSPDFMEVRELLIIKTENDAIRQEAERIVRNRVEERRNVFESYGPEQFAMLGRAEIYVKDDYLVFIVADDPAAILSLIRREVEA
nr:DUF4358 domain-containing protein [Lachnospiraceae bacterium]